jgi:hypothetical protein
VFTASWDLLTWSPLWAALLGEPVRSGTGRPNLLRSHFTGTGLGDGERRIVSRSGGIDAFEASLVADLRRVHGRYPGDRGVRALVEELLASSERFRELWDLGQAGDDLGRSVGKAVQNAHESWVDVVAAKCPLWGVAPGEAKQVIALSICSEGRVPRCCSRRL